MFKIKKISLFIMFITILVISIFIFSKSTLEKKIVTYLNSQKNIPISLVVQDAKIKLIPPQVLLNDIEFNSKEIKSAFVGEMKIYPSIFSLLKGDFYISELGIADGYVKTNEINFITNKKSKKIDFSNILKSIPIDKLTMKNINLNALTTYKDSSLLFENLNAIISKTNNSATLKITSGDLLLSKGNEIFPKISIISHLVITEKKLNFIKFYSKTFSSFISTSGVLELNPFQNQNIKMQGKTSLDLKELTPFINLITNSNSNRLEGKVSVQIDPRKEKENFSFASEQLKFNEFYIGNLNGVGKYKNKNLNFKNLKIESASKLLNINDLNIELSNNYVTNFSLKIHHLNLHEFLRDYDLDVPVFTNISGNFPCQGQIKKLRINCQGNLITKGLKVNGDTQILDISKTIKSLGKVEITSEKINYQADLSIGIKSHGSSTGTINYKKGFNIAFRADAFDFEDIKNLADLKILGNGKILGSTTGNSQTAKFTMDISGDNFIFEDYYIGKVNSSIKYNRGILSFNDFKSSINNSKFLSNFSVNLDNLTTEGTASCIQCNLKDLSLSLQKNFSFVKDISASGIGELSLQWNGPLVFRNLDYSLIGNFKTNTILGQFFKQIDININSFKKNIEFKNFLMKGKDKLLSVSGLINNKDIVNVNADLSNLNFNQLSFISNNDIKIFGKLDGNIHINGQLNNIKSKYDFVLSNAKLAQTPIGISVLSGELIDNVLTGKTSLFSKQVTGNYNIPTSSNKKFTSNFQFTNWHFFNFLYALYPEVLNPKVSSSLNGELILEGKLNDLQASNGQFQLSEIEIRKRHTFLKLKTPQIFNISNRKITFKPFNLHSHRDFLIKISRNSRSNRFLSADLHGNTDLGLISYFVRDLNTTFGNLSLSVNLSYHNKFKFLGIASINNSLVKIPEFPHVLSNLSSDIKFKNKSIFFENVKADFADGKVNGRGVLKFKGSEIIPYVKATFNNVKIKYPDEYFSTGSGDMSISGKKEPFIFKVNYNVYSGLIKSDFDEEDEEVTSSYIDFLPKNLMEQDIDFFKFDININTKSKISIKNEYANGLAAADLKITYSSSKLKMLGQAFLTKNSIMKIKNQEFLVDTANFIFKNNYPINPGLYVTGNSRVKDYSVSIIIQGDIENPKVSLSSDPPLSEQDILSLLTLGITSETLNTGATSSQQATHTSYTIGASLLANSPLGNEIKDRFGWEMEISPTFDQENNVTVPKITFSKQLTKLVGASASYESGKSPKTDLKLKYNLSNNMSLIGTFENVQFNESTLQTQKDLTKPYIFGLDLEYKKEFK